MKKYLNYIYTFFLAASIFTMLWAIFTTIFSPRIGEIFSLFRNVHSTKTIILINSSCFVFTLLLYPVIARFLAKGTKKWVLSNKFTFIFFTIELTIYFISLLLFIKFIGFKQAVDDAAITLKFLDQLSLGEKWGYNYMYSNPQNLLLMYIFSAIRTFFGPNYSSIIIVFSLMHIITILLTFLSLKNLKVSNLVSLVAIQILVFAIQITLHVPVAYTDILSLFFMSVTLFFFTSYLKTANEGTNKFSYLYIILTSIFCVLGFISKGTVLILVIALSLFLLLYNNGKRRVIGLVPFIFLFFGHFLWGQFIDSQNLFPDKNYGQPNTHYIMMGLHNTPIPDDLPNENKAKWTVGAYDSSEQRFTWDMFLDKKMSKEKIQVEHIKVIKQRLKAMNLIQLIQALNNKVSVTWGSGDLKSSFEVFLGTGKNQEKMWVFQNNFSGLIVYSIMMVIQYLIYLGIIFSAIKFFKVINPFIFFSSIYITGYFVFLLIWESSPRYSMGIFIPAILAIGLLFQKSEEKHKKIV
ncbi:hypothetical protein BCR22_13785 [Enterococcus plantarum]|uniref:glycosyltransferase family 39 protein n=1 Tax=Enterococcus TaxID=1350 RepID=UPI00084DB3FA|nr:glycosyltransferase family 39 protein [Enterococcus plantarum]MBO0422102.1 glycosyltransferase family 39 protein [Enterococcus plantarum]MBO0468641.1 glycosyltransferase family 39 protein [Enterococcus plantarum]OEG15385.1 hypothetical protein BCR22_13785 [Enterococcus plantarum]